MTAPAATLPHAAAIASTLSAASLVVGTNGRPETAGGLPQPAPYVTVWISAGYTGADIGTLGDIYRDLEVPFQTTSVGDTPEQAMNVHDRVAAALLGAMPSVAGRSSQPIWLDERPSTPRRDDEAAEPLYLVTARWMFRTTA